MKEEIEIWKDIPNYEGLYQASNLGNIKVLKRRERRSQNRLSMQKEKIMKPSIDKEKRKRLPLRKDGKDKTWLVHRLILITFEGYSPNPEFNQVNHLDGNPSNNRLYNLEWTDQSGNIQHSYDVLGRSAGFRQKVVNSNSRKIDQFDLDGNFINTFPSLTYAMLELNNGVTMKGISSCITGKSKTHKGFIWKYAENKKAPVD